MRLILLVVASLAVLQAPALGADWKTHSNPEPAFTIRYPADWVKIGADKDRLTLGTPDGRGFGVTLQWTPKKLGLGDVESSLPRTMSTWFSDYQPLRTDPVMLDGQPGAIHYFTATLDGDQVYLIACAVASNTHVFLLVGMTAFDSTHLQEEVTLLRQIIMGFRPGR